VLIEPDVQHRIPKLAIAHDTQLVLFFGIIHRLNYKIIKLQRFGSWILLPSSGKKGGRGQKAYLFVIAQQAAFDSFIDLCVIYF
jgi:hypothetical protein